MIVNYTNIVFGSRRSSYLENIKRLACGVQFRFSFSVSVSVSQECPCKPLRCGLCPVTCLQMCDLSVKSSMEGLQRISSCSIVFLTL